jgi:hypothetical protein
MKKTFFASSADLDEEGLLVEAEDINEARELVLQELGWYVIQEEFYDVPDDGDEE